MKKDIELPADYIPFSYEVTADSVIVKAYDSQMCRAVSIKVNQLPSKPGKYFADLVAGEAYPDASTAAEVLEILPDGLLDSLCAAKADLVAKSDAYRKNVSELIQANQEDLVSNTYSEQEMLDVVEEVIQEFPPKIFHWTEKSLLAPFHCHDAVDFSSRADVSISARDGDVYSLYDLALKLTARGIKLDITRSEDNAIVLIEINVAH